MNKDNPLLDNPLEIGSYYYVGDYYVQIKKIFNDEIFCTSVFDNQDISFQITTTDDENGMNIFKDNPILYYHKIISINTVDNVATTILISTSITSYDKYRMECIIDIPNNDLGRRIIEEFNDDKDDMYVVVVENEDQSKCGISRIL
jgi:hypothetical protein